MVIDMGTHVLPHAAGTHMLVQVAVPALEERCRSRLQLWKPPKQPGTDSSSPIGFAVHPWGACLGNGARQASG